MNTDTLSKTSNLTISNDLTLQHIVKHMPGHVYWKNCDGVYLGCTV